MPDAVVTYRHTDGIGLITIDNPPVNALSHPVRSGISDALSAAAADDVKAIAIVCAGKTFIAGADIKEFGKPPQPPSLPEIIATLESQTVPVVAALHGNALGGGLEVALAAHYRIAQPSTKLGLPEVKLGLLPGAGGTQRLPRLVGIETAMDMILGGAPVTADAAHEMGLIDAVSNQPPEEAAISFAKQLLDEGAPPRPTGLQSVTNTPDASFFETQRDKAAKRFKGQLAPGFIIELVEKSASLDIAEGQALEREYFLECRNSPQSAAMRHVFFAERATAKVPSIGKEVAARSISRIAVIGAGTMGGGIAMNFAQAGLPVTLVETSEEALERGLALVRKNYDTSRKRGRFTQEQVNSYLANLAGTTDYDTIGDADVVIEAVFENMDVKKEVFAKLDAACKPGCILATNTSYLDIDEIAAATSRPEDVIGAHFFSPANVMKLLEVVRADETADDVIITFMQLAKRIGKIPVLVGVCHGFVGNRMLKGYGRQAQLLLLEGATPAQIDGAMEDWGMAMGPLAVGDLAGLDIGYRSRRDQGIEPGSQLESALPDGLVDGERLGQKSGAGYYRYDPETRKRMPDPEVLELKRSIASKWSITQREIRSEEIIDRLTLALINEGAAIVDEGIAARPSDVDVVYLNGYGFPKWRGGPLFYADALGLETVVSKLEGLREQTGDAFWEPNKLLRRLSREGETLKSLN
ncbi:MAG: 3-hydroxyacyl-CoA dehydrogenase NAD-binding domain-containing protein [Pseudomonadota bacterium]